MAKPIGAGEMRDRIEFQRETRVEDDGGGGSMTWTVLFSRWAKVAAKSGNERDFARQTQSPADYRIVVRNDSGTRTLLEKDRILWRGHLLNIRFIERAPTRDLFMQIDAELGVAV